MGAKHLIIPQAQISQSYKALLEIPSDVIDTDHIEGAKFLFMKKYRLPTMDDIKVTVSEYFGTKSHSEDLESAILEGSGRWSAYMITLMKAYRYLVEED